MRLRRAQCYARHVLGRHGRQQLVLPGEPAALDLRDLRRRPPRLRGAGGGVARSRGLGHMRRGRVVSFAGAAAGGNTVRSLSVSCMVPRGSRHRLRYIAAGVLRSIRWRRCESAPRARVRRRGNRSTAPEDLNARTRPVRLYSRFVQGSSVGGAKFSTQLYTKSPKAEGAKKPFSKLRF